MTTAARHQRDARSLSVAAQEIERREDASPVALLVFAMDPRRIGGIEVHTRELAKSLSARGWRTVLCYHNRPCPEVRQYLDLPNVTLEEHPGAWSGSLDSAKALFRIVKKHRPDLIHFQFTPVISFNPWIARLAGVERVFVTDHSSHPEGFLARRASLWKRLAGKVLNIPVSHGITVSSHNKRIVEATGTFPASKLRMIYNGVDLFRRSAGDDGALRERFRSRYRIPPERIVILQLSQMILAKGVADVLEAGRLALAQGVDIHLLFAGDGRNFGEFVRMAQEPGLEDRVTWLGQVVDPFAEGLYAAADICCLASRWQEAFGLVIAEAMSSELPVVGARSGAIPELIADGKTGFLVNPRDPAGLAECIRILSRDPELRGRLGRAGRERATGLFDVRTNVEALMKLYFESEEYGQRGN